MEVEIGTASHEEIAAFLRPISVAFGREPDPEDERTQRFATLLEPERMHVARENGGIVGSAGAFTYELTVPGGFVPAAGITVVGVLPTHRRRGILRELMRTQLDDIHRRGEPIAYLWASEERIYGRFGYGVASLVYDAELDVRRVAFRDDDPPAARVRLVDEADAWELIPSIYERVRAETPGMFSRSEAWWRSRCLTDPPGGARFRAVLEIGGRPEAYALYTVAMDFDAFAASMDLSEAMGATPEATREIWRYLASVDLVKTIKTSLLPVDHQLVLALDQRRALNLRVWDGLWLRVVDVERALAARRLGAGQIVLEVRDAFCSWNDGRWRIANGRAERTDAEPDLRAEVAALASTYLSGFSWSELARAGQAEELREGSLHEADALFAWDRKPWCPEIF